MDARPEPPEVRAEKLLRKWFGVAPSVIASAHGRVNLIGEHVDYCGGLVLPVAIPQRTCVAIARTDGKSRRAVAEGFDEAMGESGEGWPHYVFGVWEELEKCGAPRVGMFAAIAGDVPIGAGLSSSAALCVATVKATLAVLGRSMDASEIADLCRRVEHRYAGVPCGLMDPFACAVAEERKALLLDCETGEHELVPVPETVRVEVVDTGVRRALADGRYAQRRAESERALAMIAGVVGPRASLRRVSLDELHASKGAMEEVLFRRARHVITEIERVRRFVDAMRAGRLGEMGGIMDASHASLREDFGVSWPQADETVERLRREPDVLGARMTGAGFGGCVVVLRRCG
ncbi:MAG TPA: galactokinase [Phycisphaerales bacterium]|nr:galactokinase [Phycisphaerales bacterium]